MCFFIYFGMHCAQSRAGFLWKLTGTTDELTKAAVGLKRLQTEIPRTPWKSSKVSGRRIKNILWFGWNAAFLLSMSCYQCPVTVLCLFRLSENQPSVVSGKQSGLAGNNVFVVMNIWQWIDPWMNGAFEALGLGKHFETRISFSRRSIHF